MQSGALAGKVSGTGGGGFMMFIVDLERRAEVIARLSAEGEGQVQTCGFTDTGVTAWRTQRPG